MVRGPWSVVSAPSPGSLRLPILMYHNIAQDPCAKGAAYYETNTSPEVFRQHALLLQEAGFKTLTVQDAARMLQRGGDNQSKHVAITFDDGFRTVFTEAFPILQSLGFTATVFLPTAFIANQRRCFEGNECLTWDEVKVMHQQGIAFGSHTCTHPALYETAWDRIEEELTGSKSALEEALGERLTTFAYPYAYPKADKQFTTRFTTLLRGARYEVAVTTTIGTARLGDDLWSLPRLPANTHDGRRLFAAKLAGAYDWLALPQAIIKSGKTLFRPTVQTLDT